MTSKSILKTFLDGWRIDTALDKITSKFLRSFDKQLQTHSWQVELQAYNLNDMYAAFVLNIQGKPPTDEVDLTPIRMNLPTEKEIEQVASNAVERLRSELREGRE